MSYKNDLWEIAAMHNGVVSVSQAEDAGVPPVELRKLAARGALTGYGHGIYTHNLVPPTWLTESTLAVALAGEGAFLHRESALFLLGLGQFNPRRVRVATQRRVRRTLPDWMELEGRADVSDTDIGEYEGIPSTTVTRALQDMRLRMPPDRWDKIVEEAHRQNLLDDQDV